MKERLELYLKMLRIRIVEERLLGLCRQGLAGDLHFSKGQESIAVGVCAALNPTDHIVTHHRTIAHEIARGADLYPLLAEVLGRRTGINGGRAGEMHISNAAIRHDFSFQLVGTAIPVSAGIAWALKYHHKNDEIVVCFVGDAASSNGQFHEGMTIAAVRKVPLLVVIENNGLAGNIGQEYYLPDQDDDARGPLTRNVANRASAWGMGDRAFGSHDGRKMLIVSRVIREAIDCVRKEKQPYLVEFEVDRLSLHKVGQGDVRSPETLAKLAERDPLKLEWERLGLTVLEMQEMTTTLAKEIDVVIARVLEDPAPEWQNG